MKLIITILSLNICALFAQNEDVVLFFSADEFNKNVLLTWTISEGNTCNGIDIFRSIDGANYTKIGDIEGICGSGVESIDYSFTDNFPEKNVFNHYRLSLGGLGYSYSVKVEVIDIPANSYQIRPQPINEKGLLLFNNNTKKQAELFVFNMNGELVFQRETAESEIKLREMMRFPSGQYSFILMLNEKEITGKIEVP